MSKCRFTLICSYFKYDISVLKLFNIFQKMSSIFRIKNRPHRKNAVVYYYFCFKLSFQSTFRELFYVSEQVSMFQFKFLFINNYQSESQSIPPASQSSPASQS